MFEGSEVSKVTRCVEILKWQSLTHSVRSGIELPRQIKMHHALKVDLADNLRFWCQKSYVYGLFALGSFISAYSHRLLDRGHNTDAIYVLHVTTS